MTPLKKPFPPGTVKRMDEILAAGGLRDRERERVISVRLLALGRTTIDVAQMLGRGESTIERHKRRFLADGEAALRSPRWGGRRNETLTFQQEAEFVAGIAPHAAEGRLVTTSEIGQALAARTGRTVDPTTVTRMLKRHGWRKGDAGPAQADGEVMCRDRRAP